MITSIVDEPLQKLWRWSSVLAARYQTLVAGGGYALNGDDDTIPAAVRAEPISDPLMFAFATHGFKGVNGGMNSQDIAVARMMRRQLEDVSHFAKINGKSLLLRYIPKKPR